MVELASDATKEIQLIALVMKEIERMKLGHLSMRRIGRYLSNVANEKQARLINEAAKFDSIEWQKKVNEWREVTNEGERHLLMSMAIQQVNDASRRHEQTLKFI